ncbi:hypothetical protein FKM82_006156 [Ascaphus truei]
MPQGKRKRSGDKVYAFFPDETWHGGKKSVAEPVLEPLSLTRAWKRCGDGFDSSRAPEAHRSSESKFQAARRLAPSFISVEETSVVGNSKEPADIVWSSSDSDVSNEESKEFLSPADSIGRYSQNTGKCHHTNNSVPAQGGSGGDIPEIIDWQNDSDFECDEERCSESEAAESAVEISDSESSLSNITVSQLQNETEPSKVSYYNKPSVTKSIYCLRLFFFPTTNSIDFSLASPSPPHQDHISINCQFSCQEKCCRPPSLPPPPTAGCCPLQSAVRLLSPPPAFVLSRQLSFSPSPPAVVCRLPSSFSPSAAGCSLLMYTENM